MTVKIGIFGSCVSRDAAEFFPNSEVVAYVARHSVATLDSPHGSDGIDISELRSNFQKRMVLNDLNGNGVAHIVQNASNLDLIFIDLTDERRGFWLFPDETVMTNSLELEACGATLAASANGARLIKLGSNEHFDAWKAGFGSLIDQLSAHGLLSKSIFLDMEWATVYEGTRYPVSRIVSKLGKRWRRLKRGVKYVSRNVKMPSEIPQAIVAIWNSEPTQAELFAERAIEANLNYVRYREYASALLPKTITRSSSELRIGRNHRWGPQPFHYAERDYVSVVKSAAKAIEQ